jgi:hypothetical protein
MARQASDPPVAVLEVEGVGYAPRNPPMNGLRSTAILRTPPHNILLLKYIRQECSTWSVILTMS